MDRFELKLFLGVLFPLTPALSLREREEHFPHWILGQTLSSSGHCRRFSLSLRERAGVRGNRARKGKALPTVSPLASIWLQFDQDLTEAADSSTGAVWRNWRKQRSSGKCSTANFLRVQRNGGMG